MLVNVCRRCAVFKPVEEVTFYGSEAVLWHLMECHQSRAYDLLNRLYDNNGGEELDFYLRDHNATP